MEAEKLKEYLKGKRVKAAYYGEPEAEWETLRLLFEDGTYVDLRPTMYIDCAEWGITTSEELEAERIWREAESARIVELSKKRGEVWDKYLGNLTPEELELVKDTINNY